MEDSNPGKLHVLFIHFCTALKSAGSQVGQIQKDTYSKLTYIVLPCNGKLVCREGSFVIVLSVVWQPIDLDKVCMCYDAQLLQRFAICVGDHSV